MHLPITWKDRKHKSKKGKWDISNKDTGLFQ